MSKEKFKNIGKSAFVLIIGCVLASCTNDSEADLIEQPTVPNGIVTFQADIRPIFQNACNECHSSPPQNNAPQPLVTLEEIMQSVENRNLIGRINSQSAPMPPSGLLPVNTRELIQEWVDGGFVNE